MTDDISTEELVGRIEAFFNRKVTKITAPGGRGRASLRVYFGQDTIIVTNRPDQSRNANEALVLEQLAPLCDHVPRFLGRDGPLLFQSDVGTQRLSVSIQKAPPDVQERLAREAVEAIFAYQAAASRTDLLQRLPRLGVASSWMDKVIGGPSRLAARLPMPAPALDRDAVARRLADPRTRFIKWDCRAGNAATGADGRMRWFDFEYAALRHGAEDLAWLVADEIWPVAPQVMFALIRAEQARTEGNGTDAYMSYLALFTTFHAVQRILLILNEVKARGWLPMSKVLGRDDVGVTPRLGMRLCETGKWCADFDPLTRPLIPLFEAMGAKFAATIAPPAKA
ncbi:MAG: hypothetical protein GC146_12540 [Limimaricola sp.]|uniref:hypothetical protein n=1 Tax=Limimaricola sp. TaxID=2211665 RepID=UPI001E102928|nr:hypothetical protein [Limimaricola sp.]MBI1418041.1 hypothetical protein [Limimaricola sp.]